MPDFSIRSDSVNVEQIMRQIRARIRDKRGVDYTEQEIQELAQAKLEKFLDPRNVRSDLLQQFQRTAAAPPNFAFEDTTLFESHRGVLRVLRKLLKPILKLFFNPNPLIQALHIQSQLNDRNAQHSQLTYELLHNLVVELTRTGIEVKNLTMRAESLSSRLDFYERRARALEGVVQYAPRPAAEGDAEGPEAGGPEEGEAAASQRNRKRRRRRGRRGGAGRAEGQGLEAGASEAGEPREANGRALGERDTSGGRASGEPRANGGRENGQLPLDIETSRDREPGE